MEVHQLKFACCPPIVSWGHHPDSVSCKSVCIRSRRPVQRREDLDLQIYVSFSVGASVRVYVEETDGASAWKHSSFYACGTYISIVPQCDKAAVEGGNQITGWKNGGSPKKCKGKQCKYSKSTLPSGSIWVGYGDRWNRANVKLDTNHCVITYNTLPHSDANSLENRCGVRCNWGKQWNDVTVTTNGERWIQEHKGKRTKQCIFTQPVEEFDMTAGTSWDLGVVPVCVRTVCNYKRLGLAPSSNPIVGEAWRPWIVVRGSELPAGASYPTGQMLFRKGDDSVIGSSPDDRRWVMWNVKGIGSESGQIHPASGYEFHPFPSSVQQLGSSMTWKYLWAISCFYGHVF